ncbi:MAG: protein TolQ [Hyphomonadaceae bacterium]|jgi:biopolymer transport protein TolQ|nr:protein TolQ [Hyphomonadaceae bacterium]MBP9233769.1 protein TolQ [Hyphomonadaceae bacterium]
MDPTALAPVVTAEDFSLLALFVRADLIVKIVMGILAFASIWSWAVAIDKWFTVGGAKSRAKRLENAFWSGQPMEDVDGRVTEKSSEAMARVFAAGAREWREGRRGGAPDESKAIIERASAQMDVAVNRETARMEAGLSTLAIIASSTPFIGLLGTVIGIMNSFRDIAAKGETNLTVVAPGIAEALFATALGLFAAIPALIFYNKFSSDIGAFSERMGNFASEVSVRLSRRLHERRDA